jgi:hypothetical protein
MNRMLLAASPGMGGLVDEAYAVVVVGVVEEVEGEGL